MPDVRQHITVVRGMPVIAAPAEIDISNAGALGAALQAAAACGYATFVVDMTSTGFCDCAGLQVLEGAHRKARAEGGELRLIIPAAGLPRIFAVTGADRVIPTFTTLDEALAETPAITIQPAWQPPSMLGILVNLPALLLRRGRWRLVSGDRGGKPAPGGCAAGAEPRSACAGPGGAGTRLEPGVTFTVEYRRGRLAR